MKTQFFICMAVMMVVANSWDLRVLQGWNDPNCAQWSSDGQTCLKCIPRAYNNAEQGKCIRVDDNCKTWSQTNGECIKCFDSYGDAWIDGNAIEGKCPYYNGPQDGEGQGEGNETIVGQSGEYDVNCKCFADDRTCSECYQNYELDDQGVCQPVSGPSNCAEVANGVCVKCAQGYYLDQANECVLLPANCTAVGQDGNCTECVEGFVLTELTTCVEEIANCSIYTTEGLCQVCDEGFYVDAQGQCVLLPENCQAVDESGVCATCSEGYSLVSQVCVLTPDNCAAVDLEGSCTQCEEGYALVLGSCQQIPENCLTTDENGICQECIEGYYLDQGKECQVLPENCVKVNANGLCTKCVQGYIVRNGECNVEVGPNPNCAQQNEDGQCTKCRNFYELEDGQCTPTGQNPFCKQGSCQCGSGKCLECKKGYFLDNQGICTAIAQNCQQYSTFDGSCTSCKDKFVLQKGQCVPQKETPVVTNLNCRVQNEDGTCKTCRKYYKLIDGECAPIGKNPRCSIWGKNKTCHCCYYPDKYYLDNNSICQQKNANCSQYDPQTGECTECDEGYTLSKGKCTSESSTQAKK